MVQSAQYSDVQCNVSNHTYNLLLTSIILVNLPGTVFESYFLLQIAYIYVANVPQSPRRNR